MTTPVVFHHSLGLTASLRDDTDVLRSFRHDMYSPDLFDGYALVDALPAAELDLHPGIGHLFAETVHPHADAPG